MNERKLIDLIDQLTTPFRKGAAVEEKRQDGLHVMEIYGYEHVDDAPEAFTTIDVVFFVVGVNREKALDHKAEIARLLDGLDVELERGPSYTDVGAALGSQEYALRLFGLGEVLKFWNVITPSVFGFEGEDAKVYAGRGFIMTSGYNSYH